MGNNEEYQINDLKKKTSPEYIDEKYAKHVESLRNTQGAIDPTEYKTFIMMFTKPDFDLVVNLYRSNVLNFTEAYEAMQRIIAWQLIVKDVVDKSNGVQKNIMDF